MHLFSTYYVSPIGTLLLQCSDESITTLNFVDEAKTENSTPAHPLLLQCAEQLDAYFNGSGKAFHLPLQQNGTAFQLKVWNLLCQISYGKTISYMDLAKRFGDVKAIRAVASANGKNNVAIIVPCHRVIGSNSKLTGYAGGLWRKQWLLEHESKHYSGLQTLPFAL